MRFEVLVAGIASALILTLSVAAPAAAARPALALPLGGCQYFSPIPGSRLVSAANNVAIRFGGILDHGAVDARRFSVTGSSSGTHAGRLTIADDARTLIFVPDRPFTPGEDVTVQVEAGLGSSAGRSLPVLSYSFSVAPVSPAWRPAPGLDEMLGRPSRPLPLTPLPAMAPAHPSAPGDTLPPGYPASSVLISNNPEPGDIFVAPFYGGIPDANLLILDNLGMPMFYRNIPGGLGTLDFKRQPNGRLTYFLGSTDKFYEMDSTYAVVDSFAAGNGYSTDLHELQLLSNGHALLLGIDPEFVDMSQIVPGGNPKALVYGLILQELDTAKNVVFQWRSWDHFAITDMASPDIALTDSVIDYVHGNAIEHDFDDNLMLSSRHLNEITKIDHRTGNIIWRLGANAVNNQFTFVNDPRGFSHQHDIRRLPNGHLTLFDNGNFLNPEYSRAVEYDVDEINHVATEVWEYRNNPDTYGGFMGDVQRRASGGTLVCWGGTYASPNLTDLHADGTKALEIAFDDSQRVWWSYRAFRFPWQTTRFAADPGVLDFGNVGEGSPATLPLTIHNTSLAAVAITSVVSTDSAYSVTTTLPVTIAPGTGAALAVRFAPPDAAPHPATLYVRQVDGSELVAQCVVVRGTGVGPTGVAGAGDLRFTLRAAQPNPFSRATVIDFVLPRSEPVRLEVLDVRGRMVATLVNAVRPAGPNEASWTPGPLPSGVYFCRLEAGGLVGTRKLVLMR